MKRILVLTAALLVAAAVASATVRTRDVEYAQDGTKLRGHLAWDDAVKGKVPGVLVVHEWWGQNAHARKQAERLARAGYVALALDMYGDGKVAEHPKDAQAFAAEATKDPAVVAARFHAARTLLESDPHVDAKRIAAIGYCFGGGVVLDMARAGEPLAAVATFHGALGTDHPAAVGAVKAPLLVMAGGADEFVPAAQRKQFEDEMKAAHADYQVIVYPGVKHSFTNPDAGTRGMPQLAYDANADRKSWASMLAFFKRRLR